MGCTLVVCGGDVITVEETLGLSQLLLVNDSSFSPLIMSFWGVIRPLLSGDIRSFPLCNGDGERLQFRLKSSFERGELLDEALLPPSLVPPL